MKIEKIKYNDNFNYNLSYNLSVKKSLNNIFISIQKYGNHTILSDKRILIYNNFVGIFYNYKYEIKGVKYENRKN